MRLVDSEVLDYGNVKLRRLSFGIEIATTYLIETDGHAILIDACSSEVVNELRELIPEYTLLTHEHCDHLWGLNALRETYSHVKVIAQEKCSEAVISPKLNKAKQYHIYAVLRFGEGYQNEEAKKRSYCCSPGDITFSDRYVINWHGLEIKVIYAPGHSPGSVIIKIKNIGVFTGDSMLLDDVTFLKFDGGDEEKFRSVTQPLLNAIPESTIIFPGHGRAFVKKIGKEIMGDLLQGKVCIVTGSGRGIGKAIAELFVSEGADVVVNDSRPGAADEWTEQNENKKRFHPYYFDITDPSAVRANVMTIKKELGHIDVLVNNAGVEFNELIGMISRANMEKMFNVNVYGTIEMIQAVSRVMSRNENGGSIINISSMVGLRVNPGQLVYSATKGAVIALTKTAAKELAPKKIRVNSIAPGLTQTEMMVQADLEKLQGRINNIAMGRIAKPNDIAGGCLLLASDFAGYISGQVLPVDGCTIM